jgi:hypothetical protein
MIRVDLMNGTRGEFVRSHPGGKNKDAARVGHPKILSGMRDPEVRDLK